MLLCIDGEACPPSVDLKSPGSLPTWQTEHSAAVGGCTKGSNHSDVFSLFAATSHRSPWRNCALLLLVLFPPWKEGNHNTLSLCFRACYCQVSLELFLGDLWFCFRDFWPLIWTSFPDQTCFLPSSPTPPQPLFTVCFNASLCSPPPLFSFSFSPLFLSLSFHISAGLPPCDIQSIGTGMDGSHCWLFPF